MKAILFLYYTVKYCHFQSKLTIAHAVHKDHMDSRAELNQDIRVNNLCPFIACRNVNKAG